MTKIHKTYIIVFVIGFTYRLLVGAKIRELLKELIEERQVKQDELACILGITQPSVSRLLSGESHFSEAHIDRLMEYFGVDLKRDWDVHHDTLEKVAKVMEEGGAKAEALRTILDLMNSARTRAPQPDEHPDVAPGESPET